MHDEKNGKNKDKNKQSLEQKQRKMDELLEEELKERIAENGEGKLCPRGLSLRDLEQAAQLSTAHYVDARRARRSGRRAAR